MNDLWSNQARPAFELEGKQKYKGIGPEPNGFTGKKLNELPIGSLRK